MRDKPIFSQVIRIWAIVLDHDNVSKTMKNIIQSIVLSHERGQQCRVCRALAKQVLRRSDSGAQASSRMIKNQVSGLQVQPVWTLF
jgi:hypothetical protein